MSYMHNQFYSQAHQYNCYSFLCRPGSVVGGFVVQTSATLSEAERQLLFIRIAEALQNTQVTVGGVLTDVESVNVTVVDTATSQGQTTVFSTQESRIHSFIAYILAVVMVDTQNPCFLFDATNFCQNGATCFVDANTLGQCS